MHLKSITLALSLAAFVTAAPFPEGDMNDLAVDVDDMASMMFEQDEIDITPEQYAAELNQMILDELPEGMTLNDVIMMVEQQKNDMSIQEINAIEQAQDDMAELQEMVEMAEHSAMEEPLSEMEENMNV
ncbi:hypothetical protein K501DRAFT_315656 [Backusella circina FSU 941]|nr:hypothetical protein K501DRAFT_315656 [Backusella circina FSU 941]